MRRLDLGHERVHLVRAPLDLVLAQFRFDVVDAFGKRDGVDDLRARLTSDYKGIEERQVEDVQVAVGPPGIELRQSPGKQFVLESPQHDWRINVSPSAATLLTTKYTRREDFLEHAAGLRSALADSGVGALRRVGVRAVCRSPDQEVLERLDQMLRSDLRGGLALDLGPDVPEDMGIVQSICELILQLDAGSMARLRAGAVPAGVSPDPILASLPSTSLLIDIDVFDETLRENTAAVDEVVRIAAANQYQLFRWAVLDPFLDHFGAQR